MKISRQSCRILDSGGRSSLWFQDLDSSSTRSKVGARVAFWVVVLKPTLFVLVAATSLFACVDDSPPHYNLSLQVRSVDDDREAVGRIELQSLSVAEIRTEQSISSADDYIEDDLTGAQACVQLRSWSDGVYCAGCPERRDYYDVIDKTCQSLVLSGTEPFSVLATSTDEDVTLFRPANQLA
ncbi:MAG: hypothetical protein WKG01_13000 [Kofleriaceae bacterium]